MKNTLRISTSSNPSKSLSDRFSPVLSEKDLFASLKELREKYHKNHPKGLFKTFDIVTSSMQTDKLTRQKLISDRLSKGRSLLDLRFSNLETTHFEGKVKALQDCLSQIDEKKIHDFIGGIKVLKGLKSELLMNFQIRNSEVLQEVNVKGLILELDDWINQGKTFEFSNLSQDFTYLNRSVRELIRLMKKEGIENGAEMMEILWKVIVKVVDEACANHFNDLEKFEEKGRAEKKNLEFLKEKEILLVKEQSEIMVKKILGENEALIELMRKRKAECENVENQLFSCKETMNKAFDRGIRSNCLKKYNKVLSGIEQFIEETEKEQEKQVSTLQSIADIMDMLKKLSEKQRKSHKGIQTDALNLGDINFASKYEEYVKLFGTAFGEIRSDESINNFVALIRRDLEPGLGKRSSFKRRTKN